MQQPFLSSKNFRNHFFSTYKEISVKKKSKVCKCITIPENMKIFARLILNFFIGLVVHSIAHKKRRTPLVWHKSLKRCNKGRLLLQFFGSCNTKFPRGLFTYPQKGFNNALLEQLFKLVSISFSR